MSKKALIRRPSPRLDEGLVTHIEREPVDVELAHRQWGDYVAALQEAGFETIEVAPAPDCPDAAFVEDTVVIYRDLAVMAAPGAPERHAEVDATREALAELGFEICEIREPGKLDGGDVLKVGDTAYVGFGGRTNEVAIGQLRAYLSRMDMKTISMPVRKVLHLKSAITALPDHTIIGYGPNVDNQASYEPFLPVPEESGAHVVVLDTSTVLMATSAPESRELLESRGLQVVTVDISEFEKLEGCVTCLSVRWGHGAD